MAESGTRRAPGLLVAGVASGVGKSTLAAGLCRWLARQGLRVAPFKATTLALESVATGSGAELARAQATQAAAAGVEPEPAMNPLLLKPGRKRLHALVHGMPPDADTQERLATDPDARLTLALAALADLRSRFDAVVCEGAGAAVEPGVPDVGNLRLAEAAGLPALLVASVAAGGAFAALHGTCAALPAAQRTRVIGAVLTMHHGQASDLDAARDWLAAAADLRMFGVVPWTPDIGGDPEDALALGHLDAGGHDGLWVAVVDLPHASNLADLDPLVAEPCVSVGRTTRAGVVRAADLVVLPGTRATVDDLAWLRDQGLADALAARAQTDAPVLGLCGGYELLGRVLTDPDGVEAPPGTSVEGLGLLPVETTFAPTKIIGRRRGHSPWLATPACGYELRHGRVERDGGEAWLHTDDGHDEGCRLGAVLGTSWHGILEHDALRAALLAWVAERVGREWTPSGLCYTAVRQARLDTLGDLVERHLDTDRIAGLLMHPAGARQ